MENTKVNRRKIKKDFILWGDERMIRVMAMGFFFLAFQLSFAYSDLVILWLKWWTVGDSGAPFVFGCVFLAIIMFFVF